MKIYLSGKISDLPPEEVRAKFAQAADQIRALGHEPVSPLDSGIDYGDKWEKHIAADIAMLLGCDAIYLLKDWKESKGARIEKAVANECQKSIYLQPDLADLNENNYRRSSFEPYP